MDAKICHKKGGIWNGRTCSPPKNTKIFVIKENIPLGQYIHIVRAINKKQAFELYEPHRDRDARMPYDEEIDKVKPDGYPKYLMRGGSSE